MKKNFHSMTDQEYFVLLCQRLYDARINIADSYKEYVELGFLCVEFGNDGREWFHKLSSLDEKYSQAHCDKQFDNCLKTTEHKISIASLVHLCQLNGIDTSKPKGRPAKTDEQRQEEQQQNVAKLKHTLYALAHWRFNTWLNRPEIQEPGCDWRPVNDRDLATYYFRVKEAGLKFSLKDLETIVFNRDFTSDFDPFRSFLDSLPKRQDGEPDYIRDFFVGHMQFGDPEYTEFYAQMFEKWFVAMVALWLGRIDENPLMPILKGAQGIGKTYIIRRILPPGLQSYINNISPAARTDKDFEISLSETPLMFLDEFSITTLQKSQAYKYVVTSSTTFLRDSYGHFRETRHRKASLIAATNDEKFIRDAEGDRRYLAVDLTGTVNIHDHPLPYEGAYAQALWLLEHGYFVKPTAEENRRISEHNVPFLMPNDAEEALRTFVRMPSEFDNSEAYSSGDLLRELNTRGFHGRGFSAVAIGKAMKAMGFEVRKIRGTYKYRVVLADYDRQRRERIEDAADEQVEVF